MLQFRAVEMENNMKHEVATVFSWGCKGVRDTGYPGIPFTVIHINHALESYNSVPE